jgi:hypothetical protein
MFTVTDADAPGTKITKITKTNSVFFVLFVSFVNIVTGRRLVSVNTRAIQIG